ncbi:MAG: amidase [Anaerolineales bacterium]|nr:amidase [Anaerolineales bacterium]
MAELEELSCTDLQARLTDGSLTSRALTAWYLARIAALDQAGPMLKSVIEVNPEALARAEALDEERSAGRGRGPLHGLPLLLKDNLDTGDQMQTTAGSLALAGWRAPHDSTVAERLRAAGAVLLGKTNLSEWANFRSTRPTSGWSSRGGRTRNPYALDRNPSGSSSGSGVAASANLCAAAIGTETDGSIISPAAANGLVGLKPSVGLVSRAGIIPISASQDTAGPMTRTVRDAALLLNAIAGPDPRDRATEAAVPELDYTRFLAADGLRGARLGVARNFFGFHPRVDRLLEDALATLRAQGAELVDPANLTLPPECDQNEFQVLLYEFKDGLNRYLAGVDPALPAHSLAEVMAFNTAHAERTMPLFGQEILQQAEAKGGLDSAEYQKALGDNLRIVRGAIDGLLAEHQLDALLAPAGAPAWITDVVNGDHYLGGCTSPAAIAGYPNLTVPAGLLAGLPVGLCFFGGQWQEGKLLRLGYAFEQATQARRPPQFRPTIEWPEW